MSRGKIASGALLRSPHTRISQIQLFFPLSSPLSLRSVETLIFLPSNTSNIFAQSPYVSFPSFTAVAGKKSLFRVVYTQGFLRQNSSAASSPSFSATARKECFLSFFHAAPFGIAYFHDRSRRAVVMEIPGTLRVPAETATALEVYVAAENKALEAINDKFSQAAAHTNIPKKETTDFTPYAEAQSYFQEAPRICLSPSLLYPRHKKSNVGAQQAEQSAEAEFSTKELPLPSQHQRMQQNEKHQSVNTQQSRLFPLHQRMQTQQLQDFQTKQKLFLSTPQQQQKEDGASILQTADIKSTTSFVQNNSAYCQNVLDTRMGDSSRKKCNFPFQEAHCSSDSIRSCVNSTEGNEESDRGRGGDGMEEGSSQVEAEEHESPKEEGDALMDRFQRRQTYLRISLTETCNLKCQYCMPNNGFSNWPSKTTCLAEASSNPFQSNAEAAAAAEGTGQSHNSNSSRNTGVVEAKQKNDSDLIFCAATDDGLSTSSSTLTQIPAETKANSNKHGASLTLDTAGSSRIDIVSKRKKAAACFCSSNSGNQTNTVESSERKSPVFFNSAVRQLPQQPRLKQQNKQLQQLQQQHRQKQFGALTAVADAVGIPESTTREVVMKTNQQLQQNCSRKVEHGKPRQLTVNEVTTIASTFLRLGGNKIRLTGGEPTIRREFDSIVKAIGDLPGLEVFGVTTNGIRLLRFVETLRAARVNVVNISLDSLRPERYRQITGYNGFKCVWKAFMHILAADFCVVKLNVVLLRNVNDDEIIDFVNLTRDFPIHVRFIEFMPFQGNSKVAEKL